MPSLAKLTAVQFGTVVVLQISTGAVQIYGVRQITTAVSPSEYGVAALLLSILSLSTLLVFGPISQSMMRELSNTDQGGEIRIILASWLILWVSLLFGGTAVMVLFWLGTVPDRGHLLLLVAILFTGVTVMNDAVLAIRLHRSLSACGSLVSHLVRVFATLQLSQAGVAGSEAILAGYIAGSLAQLGTQAYRLPLRSIGRNRFGINSVLRVALSLSKEAVPYVLWSPFAWLQTNADRFALATTFGTEAVGKYQAMSQIGYSPTVLMMASVVQFLAPTLLRAGGRDAAPVVNLCLQVGVFATIALTATVLVGGSVIVGWLIRPSYFLGELPLSLLVCAGLIYGLAQMLSTEAIARGGSRSILRTKIVSCSLGAVLGYGATSVWGPIGGAIATMLFSLTFLFLIYMTVIKLRVSNH